LLHVQVPELQELWQEVAAAEQQVASAAADALSQAAETFLGSYGVFRGLVRAVADLDVLAGFAQVSGSHVPTEDTYYSTVMSRCDMQATRASTLRCARAFMHQ
jgi:DNA mismatch repair ATPase MutS